MKVIVAGGGTHGSYVARKLVEADHHVTVIEPDESVQPVGSDGSLPPETVVGWIYGDACDPEVCASAGVGGADAVVALTRDDAANLVIAQLAKAEFGVETVVARVNLPENRWLFDESWGVDVAISSHDVIAQVISEEVTLGDVVALLKASKGGFSVVELTISPESPAIGRTVAEIDLPAGCLVVTILRNGRASIPGPEVRFAEDDEVVAVTDSASHQALRDSLAGPLR